MYMILLSQTRDISARVQYLVQQSLGNLIELHVLGKYQTIKPCNHAACKASNYTYDPNTTKNSRHRWKRLHRRDS